MNDDELRRRLDRLAGDSPPPGERRRSTVRSARRRARLAMMAAGVAGAATVIVGVLAVNAVVDRPRPPAPSVIGPAPTGTAVPEPTQNATPPPDPEGRLAFWSDSPTGGSAALMLIDADGSNRREMGDLSISTSGVSLSPDGSHAVFDHGKGPGDGQLDVMDFDTGQVVTIFDVGLPQAPDWSADGTQIVFHTELAALFTMPASGGTAGTPVRILGPDEFLRGLSPSWSPSGKEIAYVDPKTESVQVITVGGHNPATTFDVGGRASSLDWGMRGIVVSVFPAGGGDSSLVLVDPDDGSTDELPDEQGDESRPALSPDGMFVAFAGNAGGRQDIYVMRLSDGRRWRLTDDVRQDLSPVWFPNS